MSPISKPDPRDEDKFQTLLDRLPYGDGSGRRRFVSGGILIIGVTSYFWVSMGTAVPEGLKIVDLLQSPTLLLASVLIIYALGMIVELIGEVFLLRAASGFFWALGFPATLVTRGDNAGAGSASTRRKPFAWFARAPRFAVGVLAVPLLLVYGLVRGFFGTSFYMIDVRGNLSQQGQLLFDSLPAKVQDGLSKPVGNDSALAFRYITENFTEHQDRAWAKKLVTRTQDVSIVTTTLLFVAVFWIFALSQESQKPELSGAILAAKTAIDGMGKDHRQVIKDFASVIANAPEVPDMTPERVSGYIDSVASRFQALKSQVDDLIPLAEIEEGMTKILEIAKYYKNPAGPDAQPKEQRLELQDLKARVVNLLERERDFLPLQRAKSFLLEHLEQISKSNGSLKSIERMDEAILSVEHSESRYDTWTSSNQDQLESLRGAIQPLSGFAEAERLKQRKRNVRTGLSLLPFLFLYVGFFVALKQTVLTIVEGLAVIEENLETNAGVVRATT